jgi:hypothetical protein
VTVDIAGDWDVTIKTPIGTLAIVYRFAEHDGALGGTATSRQETVDLTDVVIAADRVTWRQTVTKPMRLKLDFDVRVVGDQLIGHSRAGRLPRSAVSGVRRS